MTQSIDADAAIDLSTTYMGLSLRTPLVASPGPLTSRLEPLQALEDNGIAAVVLPSLFEEQVVHDELQGSRAVRARRGREPRGNQLLPRPAGLHEHRRALPAPRPRREEPAVRAGHRQPQRGDPPAGG